MAEIRKASKEELNINEILEISQDAIMSRLNCHLIGKIRSFNKNTQTCEIEMMQVKQFQNKFFIPSLLVDVPLIILGAGGGHITMPNPIGTICLLLFLDRNIDNFMETGEQYVPDTARMHDFTDAIALTTFTTLANPIQNYDENAITIFNEGLIEEVQKISYIKIYPNLIQIQAADGANITLNDKVSISNSSQNLGALIKELILAIEGLTINTNTGTVMQSSIDTLEEIAEKFAALINTPEEE